MVLLFNFLILRDTRAARIFSLVRMYLNTFESEFVPDFHRIGRSTIDFYLFHSATGTLNGSIQLLQLFLLLQKLQFSFLRLHENRLFLLAQVRRTTFFSIRRKSERKSSEFLIFRTMAYFLFRLLQAQNLLGTVAINEKALFQLKKSVPDLLQKYEETMKKAGSSV